MYSAVMISAHSEIMGPFYAQKSKETQLGPFRFSRYYFSTLLWPWLCKHRKSNVNPAGLEVRVEQLCPFSITFLGGGRAHTIREWSSVEDSPGLFVMASVLRLWTAETILGDVKSRLGLCFREVGWGILFLNCGRMGALTQFSDFLIV